MGWGIFDKVDKLPLKTMFLGKQLLAAKRFIPAHFWEKIFIFSLFCVTMILLAFFLSWFIFALSKVDKLPLKPMVLDNN